MGHLLPFHNYNNDFHYVVLNYSAWVNSHMQSQNSFFLVTISDCALRLIIVKISWQPTISKISVAQLNSRHLQHTLKSQGCGQDKELNPPPHTHKKTVITINCNSISISGRKYVYVVNSRALPLLTKFFIYSGTNCKFIFTLAFLELY